MSDIVHSKGSQALLMDVTQPPEPFLVPLEITKDGLERHSYEHLVKHLELHLDPSIRSKILFFFLTGSRLYGTSTPESDWDYMCITSTATNEARKSSAAMKSGDESISAAKPFMGKEGNVYDMDATLEYYNLSTTDVPKELKFDVTLYEIDHWRRMGFEQNVLPMEAQLLPTSFICYKDPSFPHFDIDPPVLKTTFGLLGGLKFANARPRIDKDKNPGKAKRLGALGIRYLQFGIQILESYRDSSGTKVAINNWHSMKPVWNELFLKYDPADYNEFEKIFRPTFKELDTYIRHIMVYPTLYTMRERFISRWESIKPGFSKFAQINDSFLSSGWIEANQGSQHSHLARFFAEGLENACKKYGFIPCLSKKQPHLISFPLSISSPVHTTKHILAVGSSIFNMKTNSLRFVDEEGELPDLILFTHTGQAHREDMEAILNSKKIEVREWVDGHRMVLFKEENSWHVSTVSGNIDGSEAICTRKTEGAGPDKSTLEQLFWKIWKDNQYEYPTDESSCYVFDLISDFSRHITCHKSAKHEILFATTYPYHPSFEPPTSWKRVKRFEDLTTKLMDFSVTTPEKELSERRRECIVEMCKNANPFECGGVAIKDLDSGKAVRMVCRSFWSVCASLGHQNRVLAFNVSFDHFEPEALRDVVLYGFDSEFSIWFPQWESSVKPFRADLDEFCNWINDTVKPMFVYTNRKELASKVAALESKNLCFKSITFDWFNIQLANPFDIAASFDVKTLRSLWQSFLDERKAIS